MERHTCGLNALVNLTWGYDMEMGNAAPADDAVKAESEAISVESLEEKMARLVGDEEPDAGHEPEAEVEADGDADADVDVDDEPDAEADAKGGESDDSHSLPDDVQEAVNRRIGKITAKRKEAEEKAESLGKRNAELEKMLNESFAEHAFRHGLAPHVVSADEVKLLNKDAELAEQEKFFLENFDGYTDSEGKEYSAGQMRKWYMEAREERSKILGRVQNIRTEKSDLLKRAIEVGLAEILRREKSPDLTPKAKSREPRAKPPAVPAPSRSAPGKPPSDNRKPGFDRDALKNGNYTPDALEKSFENMLA
jgi:hypothetical protein